jgi:putative membrane protein
MKYFPLMTTMLLVATPAFAQQAGNPGVMSPDTPGANTQPADHPNTADQLFTRQAIIGGQSEVQLAELASSRAQNDAVTQFAKRMADDHRKANDALMRIAKANKADMPKSPDVDSDEKTMRGVLEKLRGAEFDTAYMAGQVAAHQKTAHLLEHIIGSGQDAKVKQYAQQTLPTVMHHLEDAKKTYAALLTGEVNRAPEKPPGQASGS